MVQNFKYSKSILQQFQQKFDNPNGLSDRDEIHTLALSIHLEISIIFGPNRSTECNILHRSIPIFTSILSKIKMK